MTAFDFKELNEVEGPFVTIMLNTHVGHSAVDQDVLQLKNLAKDAQNRFAKKFPDHSFEPFQKQIDTLLNDQNFFRNGYTAVALIFTPEKSFVYPLTISVDNQYYVSERPYLLALVKNAQFNYHYYLLALNRDSMKVYEYHEKKLTELELPDGAPKDLETALGTELTGGNINYSTQGSAGGRGKEGLAFHGVSSKDEEEEIDHTNYYLAVDTFLKGFLPDKKIPLYLMALPENQFVYKKVSKLDQLKEPALTIAPSALTKKEIIEQLPKLETQLTQKEVKDYNQLLDRKFSDQLVDIQQATGLGKVSHLFIATNLLQNGFGSDPDTEYDRRQVLNQIAYQVAINGGEVHLLDQKDAPDEKSLVAILRF
ncbi:baeRF6 domain-containing protein [Enterococcus timonensis]|uniref:baeRF6 domain-containing protein n=1 Tax=Enterococcus timonensis TaxID=1852364 RepID=UPI0008DAEF9D|nr:hypothetical protein [Enterococcus timonensis]